MADKQNFAAGVREYVDGMDVVIEPMAAVGKRYAVRFTDGAGRMVIKAFNEGGYGHTAVDLLDILAWTRDHMPEVMIEHAPVRRRFPRIGPCSTLRYVGRLLDAITADTNGSAVTERMMELSRRLIEEQPEIAKMVTAFVQASIMTMTGMTDESEEVRTMTVRLSVAFMQFVQSLLDIVERETFGTAEG